MIFFFRGRPSALFTYQTSFTAVSFASEPEFANNTLPMPAGAIPINRSASSVETDGTLPPKL